ncbi:nose resistant to fluoxetine protein 6 isoform X2 [Megalopta genalis]|uniref:nose resistant to fluoxetine protein 6 isoform X2 n=1 Tax=Megalopta genalis TaxID=115081 RepID=UPI003FCF62B3
MRISFILFVSYVHWCVGGLKVTDEGLTTISDNLKDNYNSSEETNLGQKETVRSKSSMFQWNDLVDVWSPFKTARIWHDETQGSPNVSASCQRDFTNYMSGVLSGEQWALKMVDASGKYTWGLFSGNVFWLGSSDQCREIAVEFLKGQENGGGHRKGNAPPFLVSITSVSFHLRSLHPELSESFRIILGLCLPDSCDVQDVRELFLFLQGPREGNSSSEVVIEAVRNLSKGYSLWEDPIFYILVFVFAVAIVFACLGTFYDVSLRYRVLRSRRNVRDIANTAAEMKIMHTDQNSDDEITIAKLWSVKEHNGAIDVRNTRSAPKPLSEALLSFSLLLNLSKLCGLDVGDDTLAPIHGLRLISMLWIILVHTCLTVNVVSEARSFRSNAEKDFFYQTISNGTYAVDTFFFMSGCLVSFLYFRTITKKSIQKMKVLRNSCGKFLEFLGMVSYRYFRLTPPYLLVIGLIQVSSSWYYHHTMLDLYTLDYQNCKRYWWRNALYVNTYFAMDERCMVWSWYLANDTLFYIVGAIILIIGVRLLSVAAFAATMILIVSWIVTATIALHTQHVPSILDPFAHYESLYDKPWSRIGPYLLGMMAGWYLYKSNCSLKLPKTVSFICWIVSFFVMLSIVYGLYGSTHGPFMSAAYTALSHSGWAVAVGWVLVACVAGHGGIVNNILSWKYLYPLSRLSYCVYLVHPVIIRAVVLKGESSMHLTLGLMGILFLGFTIASYIVALVISILFEAPVVSLLRIVHPLRAWKK